MVFVEEISSMVLSDEENCRAYSRKSVTNAIITFPAYFIHREEQQKMFAQLRVASQVHMYADDIVLYIVHDLDEYVDFTLPSWTRAQFEDLNGEDFWTKIEPVAKAVS